MSGTQVLQAILHDLNGLMPHVKNLEDTSRLEGFRFRLF